MIDMSGAILSDLNGGSEPQCGSQNYGPAGGSVSLREVAANWYNVEPQRLAVTTGASMGLSAALASSQTSKRLLCPRPYYPVYPRLAALFGFELKFYDLKPTDDWRINGRQLLELVADEPAVILVNWPSNPAGCVATETCIQTLIQCRDQFGCEILCDESYGDFVYDNRPRFDLAQMIGSAGLVQVKSTSKLLRRPGDRIGFVIADPERLLQICHAHWTMALSPPIESEARATAAMSSELEVKLKDLLIALEERRDFFCNRLDSSGIFELGKPAGGIFLWAKLSASPSQQSLFAENCAVAGVQIAEGKAFGMPSGGWMRLSFALDFETLSEAGDRLIMASRQDAPKIVSAG